MENATFFLSQDCFTPMWQYVASQTKQAFQEGRLALEVKFYLRFSSRFTS